MLEVAKQQVCMSVSCTFLKYRYHYTSNIIVAGPMQWCNYYMYMYIHVHVHIASCLLGQTVSSVQIHVHVIKDDLIVT